MPYEFFSVKIYVVRKFEYGLLEANAEGCAASDTCSIETIAGSKVCLNAKNNVVYGVAYVYREKKDIDHSRDNERNWWIVKIKKGKNPNEVAIPVDGPLSSVADHPWEADWL